jgi:hypothetical protein
MDTIEGVSQHFSNLIWIFASSGLAHLGKLANSEGKTFPVNLEKAKFAIDSLIMLRDKMQGNLTPSEAGLLGAALADLEIKYAEAVDPFSPIKKPQVDGGPDGNNK